MGARYDSATNMYVPDTPMDDVFTYTADGAIAPRAGIAAIAKTSVAAMTLADPTADMDGVRLVITAKTAFAHVVTVTSGLGGNSFMKVGTFSGAVGATVELLAFNGKWTAISSPFGVTFA